MEVADTGGAGDTPSEIQSVAVADTQVLTAYLKNVVAILLEGDEQASANLKTCLDSKEYQEALRKFIADPQTRALFIQRQSMKG
jgi:dynein heavy chain 1, cytosolic